jgi:hypothetical protein
VSRSSVGGVAEFLLEQYVSRADGGAVERGNERARIAAEELTQEGTPIRFVRSIFVPEDETCFYLYEAASVEAVRELAKRAALPFARVTEACAAPQGDTDGTSGRHTWTSMKEEP